MKKIIRNHQKNIANAFLHSKYYTINNAKYIDRIANSYTLFVYDDVNYYNLFSYDGGVLFPTKIPSILCSCFKSSYNRKSRVQFMRFESLRFSVDSKRYKKYVREYRDGMYKSYEQLMVSL